MRKTDDAGSNYVWRKPSRPKDPEAPQSGWLNTKNATSFAEAVEDGVSVATGVRGKHQILYLSKNRKKWLVVEWSDNVAAEESGPGDQWPDWWPLSPGKARAWLLANGHQEAVAEYFPPLGRRSIGPKVDVRFAPETLELIDQRAAEDGVDRAEVIRRLVKAGLA